MDILTEIYRIKQVMGLITEQNDESLVDEKVYDAIKNIESVFSFTDKDGNIKPRPKLTGKEKEQNIKNVIQDTIGLDYWKKMNPKLQGQVYSFMYQADSDTNSFYRWLAGLYDAIILDENEKNTKMSRSDIFTNKVPKLDVNGKETGEKEILPRNALPPEKQNNIKSAIKKVQDAIINKKINYDKYMDIVKKQYETLGGTPNDAANKLKIWGPRPEALNKLMSNESWDDVKKWWYKEIGESNQTNQVTNTSTQKDSSSPNPNVVQPPVVSQQDSIPPTNTAQQNTDAPATTTPQVTVQSTEILNPDTFKDGEHGDPYVYIQNTSGDFLTFKCGKRNEKCLGLSNKQYNSIPWINVTKGRIDGKTDYLKYENGIRVDIYNLEPVPTGQEEPNQTEETTPENDTNSKIKKAFRNEYYKYLIDVIKRKLTEKNQGYTKVARTPCFYDNTSDCGKDYTFVFRNTNNNKNYFKIFLDSAKTSVNGLPKTDISDDSLNESMNKFTNKMMGTGINIDDKTYKIKDNNQNSIMQLSKVFDADTTEPQHNKNEKVQKLNASKNYYIYKA